MTLFNHSPYTAPTCFQISDHAQKRNYKFHSKNRFIHFKQHVAIRSTFHQHCFGGSKSAIVTHKKQHSMIKSYVTYFYQ